MITHQEFKKKWLWKWFSENKDLWFQCVAGCKVYCKEVFWQTLGNFWWSAYNWFKTWSPFKNLKFQRFINTPEFLPKVWDIVFFDKDKQNWMYGHVWIIDFANLKTMKVLNQNMGTGLGHSEIDKFKISNFDFSKCLWFYRYID